MQDGYIRLGDPTTSGGKVIEASGFPSNGLSVAYENDKAMCPLHGIVAIVDGYPGWMMGGRRVATEMLSKLQCGCGLISTSREFLYRSVETTKVHITRAVDIAQEPTASRWQPTAWAGQASTSFSANSDVSPCAQLRHFTADEIRIIQSYDTIKQVTIELSAGSSKTYELAPMRQQVADALNQAGRVLEAHTLCEHIDIYNKLAVYLCVERVATSKAFVSKPPVFDLVVNSDPFARLWRDHRIGLMLHEIHHFSHENRQTYNEQVEAGAEMGSGTPYENECFRFQAKLGFPAN